MTMKTTTKKKKAKTRTKTKKMRTRTDRLLPPQTNLSSRAPSAESSRRSKLQRKLLQKARTAKTVYS